ncbi:MAG: folate-binding protein, partial [Actinomycetota bacterium]|nr:folate-binding protein [Actinomycetota bacterium]
MVAVAAQEGDFDEGVPWHYGDPMAEQRELAAGRAAVDLSHFGVVRVSGPDRLPWLHSLTSQHLEGLAPGRSSLALI